MKLSPLLLLLLEYSEFIKMYNVLFIEGGYHAPTIQHSHLQTAQLSACCKYTLLEITGKPAEQLKAGQLAARSLKCLGVLLGFKETTSFFQSPSKVLKIFDFTPRKL